MRVEYVIVFVRDMERAVGFYRGVLEEPQQVFGARVAKYVDPGGMPFSVGEETSHTD